MIIASLPQPRILPKFALPPPGQSGLVFALQPQELLGLGERLLQDGQTLRCAARHHGLPHGFLGRRRPYAHQLAPGHVAAAPHRAACRAFRLAAGGQGGQIDIEHEQFLGHLLSARLASAAKRLGQGGLQGRHLGFGGR